MKDHAFIKFHKRRKIPERLADVVAAWNAEFPDEATNANREINLAVEARLRKMERALKIRRKYLT